MKEVQLSKKAQALTRKILSEDKIRLISQLLKEFMGQPFDVLGGGKERIRVLYVAQLASRQTEVAI